MESPFKGKTGLKRIWSAFHYSLDGLREAHRCEDAFRQEVLMAIVLIPIAIFSNTLPLEKAMLIGSVLLVLIVELVNSAVEATVDRVSLEQHHLAKRAKDIGSASVLMSLMNLGLVWGLVFLG